MPPLVDVTVLQARPGFANADPDELAAVLDDASAIIRDIAEPVELDPATLPPTLIPVITAMVRRGLDNPLGIPNEQTGDWQGSGRASLYPTRREVKMIRRAAKTSGAGSITLVSPYSGDISTSGS